MYYYRQYTLVRILRVSVRFETCCLIHVFEEKSVRSTILEGILHKGREKTSSPMQDGDASIPRDRGILTQGGELSPNWGRKKRNHALRRSGKK